VPRTRIAIADDHTIVRVGLCSVLGEEPDFEVVGEASDGAGAVRLAGELKPDVFVMDLSMPAMSGFEAIRMVRDLSPASRVVVLTMHEDELYVLQALEAGASAYLVKGSPPSELCTAIRAVVRGEAYFCPAVARHILANYLRRPGKNADTTNAIYSLSSREREVLRLIGDGLTSREIASRLILSVNTIERHRANLMEKLGVHNRVDLVKLAMRHGLVALET
jgi:two-component system response regulator NreC